MPDGDVQALDSANRAMMGISTTGPGAGIAPFPCGSCLVMFTDGLIERRDRPFGVGLAKMEQHLAALGRRLDPDDLVESLLDALIGAEQATDDVAIVAVQRTA